MRAKSQFLNDDSSVWICEARDAITKDQLPSASTTMAATVVSQHLIAQELCNLLTPHRAHAAPPAILAINIIFSCNMKQVVLTVIQRVSAQREWHRAVRKPSNSYSQFWRSSCLGKRTGPERLQNLNSDLTIISDARSLLHSMKLVKVTR